jgi:hypothetical protein
MTRDSKIQVIAAAVLVSCLVASGVLATGLAASAGRHKLTYTDQAEENSPPQVALGIAMGAFRGIFVNFLWMRANALKEEGKYYEAVDLAKAITKLQPRFPRVWVFHAWNMAYNISVATQTPEERWQWVSAGIHLLRGDGVKYNPNDMLLQKELAWIFLHKVQGYTDDANIFYKQELAKEWHTVLGPPPPPDPTDRDRDKMVERYAAWISRVADAPETLQGAIAQEPSVRTLVDQLQAQLGLSPDWGLLVSYELQRAIMRSGHAAAIDQGADARQLERRKLLRGLMADPSLAKAWDALLLHVRKRVLIDRYNMEPQRMVRYTRKYGPLDWRHAASHAIYWSARGVEEARVRVSKENEKDFDFVNTDRVVIQSAQELWRTGQVYFDYLTGELMEMPGSGFLRTYGDILGEAVERSKYDITKAMRKDGIGARAYSFYSEGYKNFLTDAICFLFRRGDLAGANKYYSILRNFPGLNINDPTLADRYKLDLAQFVEEEMKDRFMSPNVAQEAVYGSLQGAFATGLLAGDMELFRRQWEYAIDCHRWFMQEQHRPNSVSRGAGRMDQFDKDFRIVAGGTFAQFLRVLTLDDALKVYDNAPNDLKLFGYDLLASLYREGLDADKAAGTAVHSFDETFPPPTGLVAFRAEMAAKRAQQQRVKTLTAPK